MQLAEPGGLGAGAGVNTGVWEVRTGDKVRAAWSVSSPGSVVPQVDSGHEASSQLSTMTIRAKGCGGKRRMGKTSGRSA